MKLLLALATGYVLGARSGGEHLDELVRSLRAVRDTEEFRDLVVSLRAQAGHTLRDLAAMLEGSGEPTSSAGDAEAASDLVARVRDLAGLR